MKKLIVVAVRIVCFKLSFLRMSHSVSLLQFEYAWEVQVFPGDVISL